jgi:hypothetical protein
VIFTGISSLLSVRSSLILYSGCIDTQIPQVVIAVRPVKSAITDLFESIKRFFIRLKIYVELPPTEEMTGIIVDVMVQVLHILALLTKEIKGGKISELILLIGHFFRLIFFLRNIPEKADRKIRYRRRLAEIRETNTRGKSDGDCTKSEGHAWEVTTCS